MMGGLRAALFAAAMLGAGLAHAQPAPAPPVGAPEGGGKAKASKPAAPAEDASAIEHGSRRGAGNSRGPGAGDGTGRQQTEPEAEEAPGPPSKLIPDDALAFSLGDVDFVPGLQYRLRWLHNDGRDFVPGGDVNFVRHRARLALGATYKKTLTTYIQLQDARSFGEESDPSGDFSADGFDIHQGYLQLGGKSGFLRLGRQEMNFNNERLLGVNEFTERSRSFDGARAQAFAGKATLDVGWALVRDFATNAEPVGSGQRHIGMADLKYEVFKALVPDIFVLFEGDTVSDLRRVTAGGDVRGRFGGSVYFDYQAEGWVQYGKQRAPQDVTFWSNLSSFQFKSTVDIPSKPFVYLEATLVSGDDDPTDDLVRTFTQPYPRAHRVLGQMDYFINFARDTDERGLRSLSSRIGWAPFGLKMDATFFIFDALADREDGLSHYGWEANFRVQRRFLDNHLGFDAVYGFFVPGELIAPTVADPPLEHFGYVIVDSKF